MDKSYNRLLENILDNAEKALTTPSFYGQLIFIITCLLLAVLVHKIIQKTPFFQKRTNQKLAGIVNSYIIPLLLPTLMITFISIGSAVFILFSKDNFLFEVTIQLIAIFIFLRLLRILFSSSIIANWVGFFLIPSIVLNIFGIFEPTVLFLDSFAVSFGKVRISIYTIVQAFVILSIVFWISGELSKKTKSYLSKKNDLKDSTKGIISKVIDILIYLIVFGIILRVFGVDMTTFALIGGAVGVGIGFGLQKIASNFISGIILLMEKSVEIGDIVELENGAIHGKVIHFAGRYTLIEAMDGREILVPNEELIINKVTNWTYNNHRCRVEFKVHISYDSEVKKAIDIILQCIGENNKCLKYPAPECYIDAFLDNSINLIVYFWVSDIVSGRMAPKNDVMIRILEEFKKHSIQIPSPQREIIIRRK